MNEIYAINDLSELENFLHSQNFIEKLREKLFAEFLKYADYKSVSEWNKTCNFASSRIGSKDSA